MARPLEGILVGFPVGRYYSVEVVEGAIWAGETGRSTSMRSAPCRCHRDTRTGGVATAGFAFALGTGP
jgi:hypothetical protein